MLHIADRLNRCVCGSKDGQAIAHIAWQWKPKSETCPECGEVYRLRKFLFNILCITGKHT